MKKQIGPRAALKRLRTQAHEYMDILPKMPVLTYRLMQQQLSNEHQAAERERKQAAQNRLLSAAILLLGSAALWITAQPQGGQLAAVVALAALGIYCLFGRKS